MNTSSSIIERQQGVSGNDLVDLVYKLAEQISGAQKIPFLNVFAIFYQEGDYFYRGEVYSGIQIPCEGKSLALVRAVPHKKAREYVGRVLYLLALGEEFLEPDEFATIVPDYLKGDPYRLEQSVLLMTAADSRLIFPPTRAGKSLADRPHARRIQTTQKKRSEAPRYDILLANDLLLGVIQTISAREYQTDALIAAQTEALIKRRCAWRAS